MPVLVEAFSVITRRDRIEECYPGGINGFFQDCPNQTACADEHLVRVGFMDPASVREFVTSLGNHGLVYRDEHGNAQDLVVINQGQGPLAPCDWAEVFAVNLAGATVEICRLAGTDSRRLACPSWWRPEKAAQHSLVFVPSGEQDSRLELLREENGLTVCRDRKTGTIMYSAGRPMARATPSADAAETPARDKRTSVWHFLRALFLGH